MSSSTVYQIVTDEIIKKLEAGAVPWRKPWKTFGPPRNLISGKPYRGINSFLLSCSPFSSPFWLTFKQADSLKGHVRKGEKSSIAVFWKQWEIERQNPDTGETEEARIPLLRFYRVFNSEQCDRIDHKRLAELRAASDAAGFDSIDQAEAIVCGMPNRPTLTENGQSAYYRPCDDTVNLPPRGLFDSPESFYSTFFHELAHSTGHASRLNRKAVAQTAFFGSADYGQEELVAEMTAAFLCGESRISPPVIDNQAAYLAGWLRTIKQDAKLVVVAAGQAQRAADYILGKGAADHENV
jgi:antirestriction protein ArdC